MDLLTFISSIIVGLFSVLGIWLTKRDVKTVRSENTSQHQVAQAGRLSAHEELVSHVSNVVVSHQELLGTVKSVHEDVREVAYRVGGLDHKISAHIEDLKVHGDSEWKTVDLSEVPPT